MNRFHPVETRPPACGLVVAVSIMAAGRAIRREASVVGPLHVAAKTEAHGREHLLGIVVAGA